MNTLQTKNSYENYLLERWQNFAMTFGHGWVFGKVADYVDSGTIYDRYDTLNAKSASASIAGSTASNWNSWETSSDYDLFYERNLGVVLQAFIGIKPVRLRLWKSMPDVVRRGNLDKIKVSSLTADTVGWIDGRDSPFENPGKKSELMIPPMMNVQFGVFNPENYAVNPVFNVKIRRMKVKWYDPDNNTDRKTIDSIVDGKTPCHFWSPGLTPSQYTFGYINIQPIDVLPLKFFGKKGS